MKVLTKLGVYFLSGLLIEGVMCGIGIMAKNLDEGKTIFGKKIEPKKTTYVDWKQRIHLGTDDFEVA